MLQVLLPSTLLFLILPVLHFLYTSLFLSCFFVLARVCGHCRRVFANTCANKNYEFAVVFTILFASIHVSFTRIFVDSENHYSGDFVHGAILKSVFYIPLFSQSTVGVSYKMIFLVYFRYLPKIHSIADKLLFSRPSVLLQRYIREVIDIICL